MRFRLFIVLVFLFVLCGICRADTIVLVQGQVLKGNILADKKDSLVVDIGIDVLTIPKDKIHKYQYDLPEQTQPEQPGDAAEAGRNDGKLYHTAELEEKTIEQCVEQFAQAVVKVSSPAGMGSGFFINKEGFLITNYHVIEKETKIEITMFLKSKNGFEKKKFEKVKIKAINPFVDLALLQIEQLDETKIKYVYLGDAEQVRVGQAVFAIGNPLGLERTVTDGLISTTNRAFKGLIYLQTNADINPGNSGGPLFNLSGEVVGVTNMGYIFFGGLGFAIPVNYVKHFVDNHSSFAYDKDNPNTGYKYLQPDKKSNKDNRQTSQK